MPEASDTSTPEEHRRLLSFIEDVTTNPDEAQHRVLAEILSQNSDAEYLHRHGLTGPSAGDPEAFRRLIPIVSYNEILPDILRIAHGDTSPILAGRPISEFLTSSGTSGGERKLMPTIDEELDRRFFFYSLHMPVMSQFVPNLNAGKGMYLLFVKSEARTPGGLLARPVLTSYYKSRHFIKREPDPYNVYTSPTEAILCLDSYQSMYAQLLCGLAQNAEVMRVGAVFASGFIRAIKFLEKHWPRMCRDIRNGTLDEEVTDRAVRAAVERILRPDPDLADHIEAECSKESWKGIIRRLWPNTKYIDVIVTGTMAQYIPTLDLYGDGLPLACTMYASSECYFGLNLNPMCKPSEVAYTLIPTMGYFEFLPVSLEGSNHKQDDLVELTDVKLGHEYELVVTTYAGLYRYRVGDVLRVSGFKNKSPQFSFVKRKNVALSIDADKTDEVELHAAVEKAVKHLEPFGASVVEYTSYADTTMIPGKKEVPGSVFKDCCLAIEESLNSVYRQGRPADGSIGALEIRVVEEGALISLWIMLSVKERRLISTRPRDACDQDRFVELLEGRVKGRYFSPRCPKWSPGNKMWMGKNNVHDY
ncbi:hypothetical protein IEQ34_011691 [Dendrobium chrysotoxum]|uniref:Uncharacterized protein n=1 Tax=Dendrobium chrysotoxum TaxID=161865 RepID=A0AAV7GR77_DENCH|nr:hypothetical protein IEQ34_011691 [Dendrobium chrysotoxum]